MRVDYVDKNTVGKYYTQISHGNIDIYQHRTNLPLHVYRTGLMYELINLQIV